MPDAALRVVLVTAPDMDCARGLARTLVEERLAACANMVPGVCTVYRWEGAVQEDDEVLLVFKTSDQRLLAFEERLMELHPYDVPACVALPPDRVAEPYLAWLQAATE